MIIILKFLQLFTLGCLLFVYYHVQILKDLKNAFWPFQLDHGRSPFLRAAEAAHCFTGANNANER